MANLETKFNLRFYFLATGFHGLIEPVLVLVVITRLDLAAIILQRPHIL